MSDSDAFKGLSVMFGFMLTLGSAGIVNQLMSGLVLVYSRALSVGDFVDLGDNVGVVSEVGVLSTKIINMRNEESDDSQRGAGRQARSRTTRGWPARAAPWCRPR
jgi:hypothetical protein